MKAITTLMAWLETFEAKGDFEALDASPFNEEELVAIGSWLNSLPEQDQFLLRNRLNSLLIASNGYRQFLMTGMMEVKAMLLASQQNVAAQSAYVRAASIPKSYH